MVYRPVIIVFVFWLALQTAYGQDSKTILASVQYKVVFIHNKQKIIDDVCQLDITKDQSYFYSKGKLENIKRIQEKYAKAGTDANVTINSSDLLSYTCNFTILKLYKQKKAIYVQNIGNQDLGFVKDSLTTKRWKISNETMTINGLLCHKAVMKKDTTSITAWFCTDVPLQDGPNYFYGLPGLIVKSSSTSGFETNLISITYNKNPKKELAVSPYILVSEAQMLKAAANQDAAFKRGKLPNGDEVKQPGGF